MAGGKGEGASAASAVCGGGGSGDSRWSHAGPAKRRRRSRARQRSRPLHRPCCFDSHKSTAAGARLAPTVVDGRGRGGGQRASASTRVCFGQPPARGWGLPPRLVASPTHPFPTLSALPLPPSLSRPHASGSVAPRARDSAPARAPPPSSGGGGWAPIHHPKPRLEAPPRDGERGERGGGGAGVQPPRRPALPAPTGRCRDS